MLTKGTNWKRVGGNIVDVMKTQSYDACCAHDKRSTRTVNKTHNV